MLKENETKEVNKSEEQTMLFMNDLNKPEQTKITKLIIIEKENQTQKHLMNEQQTIQQLDDINKKKLKPCQNYSLQIKPVKLGQKLTMDNPKLKKSTTMGEELNDDYQMILQPQKQKLKKSPMLTMGEELNDDYQMILKPQNQKTYKMSPLKKVEETESSGQNQYKMSESSDYFMKDVSPPKKNFRKNRSRFFSEDDEYLSLLPKSPFPIKKVKSTIYEEEEEGKSNTNHDIKETKTPQFKIRKQLTFPPQKQRKKQFFDINKEDNELGDINRISLSFNQEVKPSKPLSLKKLESFQEPKEIEKKKTNSDQQKQLIFKTNINEEVKPLKKLKITTKISQEQENNCSSNSDINDISQEMIENRPKPIVKRKSKSRFFESELEQEQEQQSQKNLKLTKNKSIIFEDPKYKNKIEEVMVKDHQQKQQQKKKTDFKKRQTWHKFKRKKIFIKRNKSLPNMKKLIDMTMNENAQNKYKYLQWKDDTYFDYIKQLLEITIQQKLKERE